MAPVYVASLYKKINDKNTQEDNSPSEWLQPGGQYLPMLLKATMATFKNQYPAYAVKSDDGAKDQRTEYPAYAVKSDDGEKPELNPG